ncbi:hypothetical protein Bca52824_067436 [Brassica carinata]|uniref:Uncharacterized protein n=1 Tax=Brassica carinata TaxID=52824 RepID=A0A8X7UCV1_BRACI|nr:hypothetical protein Bca52824_067436 [Brassica carinata]
MLQGETFPAITLQCKKQTFFHKYCQWNFHKCCHSLQVVDSVPETNPLIVYLRDVEKLLESERIYKFFLILLNKISGPVLILGSKVLVPEDDIQEVGERVSALFPYNIDIRPPEDESQILSWKNRLEEDTKMVQLQDNKNQSIIPHEPQYIIASLKGCKRVCMFDALALACHNKYESYRSEPKIVVATRKNPTLLIASRNMLRIKKGSVQQR